MADLRTLAATDTIAAASTTDIGTKDSTFLTLTGTAVTITALGTVSAGIYKAIIYNAAHTLTYNATTLILIGGESRTVTTGSVSIFLSEGSGNWREIHYARAGVNPEGSTRLAFSTVSQIQSNASKFAAGAGTADAITATFSPVPRLTDGMEFHIRASGANTITAPTFNPIGLATAVTITNASPAVVTQTAHGRYADEPVVFTTSGTLPTGLTAGTTYYILAPTTDTYTVSATVGGAAINTSSAGSGTHTGTCGAHTVYKLGGQALAVGDIYGAGHEMILRYRQSPARYEFVNAPKAAATPATAASAMYNSTNTYSLTSTTAIDVTSATVNITTTGGNLLVTVGLQGTISGGQTVALIASVDSVDISPYKTDIVAGNNTYQTNMEATYLFTGIAAGTHTVKLRSLVNAGTFTTSQALVIATEIL